MTTLVEYLKNEFSFSSEITEKIAASFKEATLEKGAYFLKEGEYCNKIGFVENGAMLYFMNLDGEEKVCDFGFEKNWVTHIKSMIGGIPTDMNIRALETTKIKWISGEKLEQITKEFPQINQLRVKLSEQYFVQSAERANELANLSAEQRYKKLVAEKPELLTKVPQYYLASYLGIKPQSLSRIRAKK